MHDSDCMREGLSQLLVASAVNYVLKRYDSLELKLDINSFLVHLRSSVSNYKSVFGRPFNQERIDTKDKFIEFIQRNAFSKFITVEGDILVISADNDEYPEIMKSIVLDAGQRYSTFLIKNVNDLAKMYKHLSNTEQNLNGAEEKNDNKEDAETVEQGTKNAVDDSPGKRTRSRKRDHEEPEDSNVEEANEGDEEENGDEDDNNNDEKDDNEDKEKDEADKMDVDGVSEKSEEPSSEPKVASKEESEAEESASEESGASEKEEVAEKEDSEQEAAEKETGEDESEEDSSQEETPEPEKEVRKSVRTRTRTRQAEDEDESKAEVEENAKDVKEEESEKEDNEEGDDEEVDEEEEEKEGSQEEVEQEEEQKEDEEAEEDEGDEDEEEEEDKPAKPGIKKEHSVEQESPRRGGRKRSLSPAVGSNKKFQALAISLINNIQSHRFSSVFLQPVSKKEVSDYYDVIYEPKDLKNIMKAVKNKNQQTYFSLEELERDIMLMFANCIMFNHSDKDLVMLARTMRDDVINTFKLFKEAES